MRTCAATSCAISSRPYGGWLIAAVVLFLAASGGFIWWQAAPGRSALRQQVEQLAQIYKDIGSGNMAKAPQQLDDLSKSGSKAVRASALFARAALALQQNDVKLATATYQVDRRATAACPSLIAMRR